MKREENEFMRTEILDAVIACKVEAAGAEVSLSKIACRAGISERTLNRYFPDKELLLYDASIRYLRHTYDVFTEDYLAMDKSGMTGLERLLLLMQRQIDHNRSDMSRAKTFIRAYTTALRTAVYRELPVSGYDARLREVVYQCVEEGVADGSIRRGAVPLDTYLLISSNYMGLMQRLIYYYSVDFSREKLLLVFNEYMNMLEKYLRAE